jgi:hypothetical protein
MDMFEELIESASTFANEEFVNKLKEVATKTESNINGLKEKASAYEVDMRKAIEKRDAIKNTVKSTLGVEEISEESLKAVIDNPDVNKLQEMLQSTKTAYEEQLSTYKQKLSDKELNLHLLETGVLDGVKSNIGKKALLNELRNGATLDENGNIVYLDSTGATVRGDDGKPLSVADKVKALYDNPDYQVFFPTKKGGGKQGGDNPNGYGVKDISKLTRSEKAKLMAEMSPAEYQELVRKSLKGK